jgi:ParB family chromosome partitioning protein
MAKQVTMKARPASVSGFVPALRADDAPAGARLLEVGLDSLTANPANPAARTETGPELLELAASIAALGVLEPLLAVPAGDWTASEIPAGVEYVVVAGARRLAAARTAGLDTVPVVPRRDLAQRSDEVLLGENAARMALTPLEEAAALARLADRGWTQQRIAQETGKSQSTVSKRIKLLNLPPAAQALLQSGDLHLDDAYRTAGLPDEVLAEATTVLQEGGWSWVGAARAAERRLQQRAARERLHARAAELGAQALEGWGALAAGLGGNPAARQLTGPDEIEAARRAGQLVVSNVDAHRLGGDAIGYYTTRATEASDARLQEDERARAAGLAAEQARADRWPVLAALAARRPTAAELRTLLVALVVSDPPLHTAARLAGRLADEFDQVPRAAPAGRPGAVSAPDERAAWTIALCAAEEQTRQHESPGTGGGRAAGPLARAYHDLLEEADGRTTRKQS